MSEKDRVHSGPSGLHTQPGSAEGGSRTAWVVLGSSGQWSDWLQWPVAILMDEQAAKDEVGRLSAAARELWSERPSLSEDDDWDEYEPRLAKWAERLAALDPTADEYDQPAYTAREVPFIATTTTALSLTLTGDEAAQAAECTQPKDIEQ